MTTHYCELAKVRKVNHKLTTQWSDSWIMLEKFDGSRFDMWLVR